MMAHPAHNPDDHPCWPELGEPLRWAVEEVRQVPPPADAVQRSVERALRIDRGGSRPFHGRNLQLFATGALVALVLIGLGVRCTYPPSGYIAGMRTGAGHDSGAAGRESRTPTVSVTRQFLRPSPLPEAPADAPAPSGPEDGVLLVGLGHLGSHWGDWEHFEPLRDLMNDLPPIDRKSVEVYLSN
jgi:hypothetical protein